MAAAGLEQSKQGDKISPLLTGWPAPLRWGSHRRNLTHSPWMECQAQFFRRHLLSSLCPPASTLSETPHGPRQRVFARNVCQPPAPPTSPFQIPPRNPRLTFRDLGLIKLPSSCQPSSCHCHTLRSSLMLTLSSVSPPHLTAPSSHPRTLDLRV